MIMDSKTPWPVVEIKIQGHPSSGGECLKITHKEGFPSVQLSIDGTGIAVDLSGLIKHLAALSIDSDPIPSNRKKA
jgi:hypothetical protein